MEVFVMTDMNNMELNEKDLENAAGGYQSGKLVYKDGYNCYRVQGVTNFLALRSEPVDSDGVIIGELYNGEEVQYLEACHDPGSAGSTLPDCRRKAMSRSLIWR